MAEAGGNALCVVSLLEVIKKIIQQWRALKKAAPWQVPGFAYILLAIVFSFVMPFVPDVLKSGIVTSGFSVFGYEAYKKILGRDNRARGPEGGGPC